MTNDGPDEDVFRLTLFRRGLPLVALPMGDDRSDDHVLGFVLARCARRETEVDFPRLLGCGFSRGSDRNLLWIASIVAP
jgi:hypothetical protein